MPKFLDAPSWYDSNGNPAPSPGQVCCGDALGRLTTTTGGTEGNVLSKSQSGVPGWQAFEDIMEEYIETHFWEAISKGIYKPHVGEIATCVWGGDGPSSVRFVCIGTGHDILTTGGTAASTWLLMDYDSTMPKYKYYDGYSSSQDEDKICWKNSTLRLNVLNQGGPIWSALPLSLTQNIKSVIKISEKCAEEGPYYSENKNALEETEDKLFVLSYLEAMGQSRNAIAGETTDFWVPASEGFQYEYFANAYAPQVRNPNGLSSVTQVYTNTLTSALQGTFYTTNDTFNAFLLMDGTVKTMSVNEYYNYNTILEEEYYTRSRWAEHRRITLLGPSGSGTPVSMLSDEGKFIRFAFCI